jgi:hypothetical protein
MLQGQGQGFEQWQALTDTDGTVLQNDTLLKNTSQK